MGFLIQNTVFLISLGTAFYVSAFLYSLYCLIRNQKDSKLIFYGTLISGFLIQGLALYHQGMILGSIPLSNTLELLQVISWCSMFLMILFQIAFRLPLLDFFGSGLVSLLGIISILFYGVEMHPLVNVLQNPWIKFHALLAIFAYGAFGLLAVTSLMYLLQDYSLSKKYFGSFFTLLPSLRKINEINLRFLLIGLISFTLAMGIGTLSWFNQSLEITHFKMFSGWGLLICYSILYFLKKNKLLNLKKSAWISLLLFVIALLSLWPVQY